VSLQTTPTYRVLEESGTSRKRTFVVGVYLRDEFVANGTGDSLKAARMAAAKATLGAKEWNEV